MVLTASKLAEPNPVLPLVREIFERKLNYRRTVSSPCQHGVCLCFLEDLLYLLLCSIMGWGGFLIYNNLSNLVSYLPLQFCQTIFYRMLYKWRYNFHFIMYSRSFSGTRISFVTRFFTGFKMLLIDRYTCKLPGFCLDSFVEGTNESFVSRVWIGSPYSNSGQIHEIYIRKNGRLYNV